MNNSLLFIITKEKSKLKTYAGLKAPRVLFYSLSFTKRMNVDELYLIVRPPEMIFCVVDVSDDVIHCNRLANLRG